MKTVYINGRFLSQPLTGIQRFGCEVMKALDKISIYQSDIQFVLVSPQKIQQNLFLENIEIKKIGVLSGQLWEQLELPLFVKNRLLLTLGIPSPLLKKNKIIVVHDLGIYRIPENYSKWFSLVGKIHVRHMNRAKRILAVSDFSKKEAMKFCSIKEETIAVIHEGHEHMRMTVSDERLVKKHGLQSKKYVLAVSSLSVNKNFKVIIDSMQYTKEPDFELVVVGGTNPRVFNACYGQLPGWVRYLGYVTDAELKALYENALCFVFPSLYEGFGLPPLEAMSCGCPVIVSNTSSLPEVCGKAALYCNPYNPREWAGKIKTVLTDETLRNALIQRGRERARQFSWEDTAKAVLSAIYDVL